MVHSKQLLLTLVLIPVVFTSSGALCTSLGHVSQLTRVDEILPSSLANLCGTIVQVEGGLL